MMWIDYLILDLVYPSWIVRFIFWSNIKCIWSRHFSILPGQYEFENCTYLLDWCSAHWCLHQLLTLRLIFLLSWTRHALALLQARGYGLGSIYTCIWCKNVWSEKKKCVKQFLNYDEGVLPGALNLARAVTWSTCEISSMDVSIVISTGVFSRKVESVNGCLQQQTKRRWEIHVKRFLMSKLPTSCNQFRSDPTPHA